MAIDGIQFGQLTNKNSYNGGAFPVYTPVSGYTPTIQTVTPERKTGVAAEGLFSNLEEYEKNKDLLNAIQGADNCIATHQARADKCPTAGNDGELHPYSDNHIAWA